MKQIEVKSNEKQVEFNIPHGDSVQLYLDTYGERRVVLLLQRAVERECRQKAATMLKAGVPEEDVVQHIQSGEWLPGGPLPETPVDKALSTLKELSVDERRSLLIAAAKEGLIPRKGDA